MNTPASISRALVETQTAWLTARRAYAAERFDLGANIASLRAARDDADAAFRELERLTIATYGPALSLRMAADAFREAVATIEVAAVTA